MARPGQRGGRLERGEMGPPVKPEGDDDFRSGPGFRSGPPPLPSRCQMFPASALGEPNSATAEFGRRRVGEGAEAARFRDQTCRPEQPSMAARRGALVGEGQPLPCPPRHAGEGSAPVHRPIPPSAVRLDRTAHGPAGTRRRALGTRRDGPSGQAGGRRWFQKRPSPSPARGRGFTSDSGEEAHDAPEGKPSGALRRPLRPRSAPRPPLRPSC